MDFRILSIILRLRSEVDCVVVALRSPQNHSISLVTSNILSGLRQFPLTEQLEEQIILESATVNNYRLIADCLRVASEDLLPSKPFDDNDDAYEWPWQWRTQSSSSQSAGELIRQLSGWLPDDGRQYN